MSNEAWDAWVRLAGQLPGVQAASKAVSRGIVQRLVGFYVLWHLCGGLDALISSGILSRATAYREKVEFYALFNVPVEDFAPDFAAAIRGFGPAAAVAGGKE